MAELHPGRGSADTEEEEMMRTAIGASAGDLGGQTVGNEVSLGGRIGRR